MGLCEVALIKLYWPADVYSNKPHVCHLDVTRGTFLSIETNNDESVHVGDSRTTLPTAA